jgi:AraC-like DNA-binding protein
MGLPALVRELGHDPAPIFSAVGFSLDQFNDPDVEIPFGSASRLLARCVEATGCNSLGLRLGERADPSLLGVVGFMLRAAPDVGAALRTLVRHLDLQDRGAVPILVTKGKETSLGYSIYLSGVEATDQIYDLSTAVICKIMRSLCGAEWYPAEVLLPRRQPRETEPYRRFFRAPLVFDAEHSAVVFPTRWLDHPIASADPFLYRHLEQEADALHAHRQSSFAANVRQLLRRSLTTGKIAVTDISDQLHMHERTLNRRLREEGTNFRRELEAIRYQVARQLLADSEMPLSKIATALDYADATAFSRAFKRWSGFTPTRWRSDHSDS